jgi:DNA-binding MarR family transcriptional regulator
LASDFYLIGNLGMNNYIKTRTNLTERDEAVTVDLFRNLMRARHLMHKKAKNVAESIGLHAAEMNVVDILGKFGPVSMGRLSRETFISPANTTNTVKKLEQAGLVRRDRSKKSDREVTVSLTAEGRRIFRKCYPRILGEAHAHMTRRLTRRENSQLAALLGKLVT